MNLHKALLVALLFVSSCTQAPQEEPDLETKVAQHEVVLQLITGYMGKLQELGVLPKPADLPKEEPQP